MICIAQNNSQTRMPSFNIDCDKSYLLQDSVLFFGRQSEVPLLAGAELCRLLFELLLPFLHGPDVVLAEVLQGHDELKNVRKLSQFDRERVLKSTHVSIDSCARTVHPNLSSVRMTVWHGRSNLYHCIKPPKTYNPPSSELRWSLVKQFFDVFVQLSTFKNVFILISILKQDETSTLRHSDPDLHVAETARCRNLHFAAKSFIIFRLNRCFIAVIKIINISEAIKDTPY